MKIKITVHVPVEKRIRPAVGEVYNVTDCADCDCGERVYFIEVNGERVGILAHECELVGEVGVVRRPVYRWRVSHSEHGSAEVVGPTRYEAILAAAKIWRVPWTPIARACAYEKLEEVAS